MERHTYRVNEMFASLQGEGANTGRAAIFLRFSGCNLRCPFCDTDFASFTLMTAEDIVAKALSLGPSRFIVLTGGEPTLQADSELTTALHAAGFTIAMETNGTRLVTEGIDWVTCSPKEAFVGHAGVVLRHADEVKVVFDGIHPVSDCGIETSLRYVQPCDTNDDKQNREIARAAISYVNEHPEWRLSLQTHKLLGFK